MKVFADLRKDYEAVSSFIKYVQDNRLKKERWALLVRELHYLCHNVQRRKEGWKVEATHPASSMLSALCQTVDLVMSRKDLKVMQIKNSGTALFNLLSCHCKLTLSIELKVLIFIIKTLASIQEITLRRLEMLVSSAVLSKYTPRMPQHVGEALLQLFQKEPRPGHIIKTHFAEKYGVSLAQINNWFRVNRYRVKKGVQKEKAGQPHNTSNTFVAIRQYPSQPKSKVTNLDIFNQAELANFGPKPDLFINMPSLD